MKRLTKTVCGFEVIAPVCMCSLYPKTTFYGFILLHFKEIICCYFIYLFIYLFIVSRPFFRSEGESISNQPNLFLVEIHLFFFDAIAL